MLLSFLARSTLLRSNRPWHAPLFTDDATRSLLMPYQVPTPTLDLIMRLASVVPAPGIGGYTLPECLLAMFLCDDFRRNGRVLSPLPDAWVREVQSAAGYVPPRPAAQAPPPPRPAPAPAPLTAPPRPATTSTTYRPPPRPAPPPATSSAPAPPSTAAPSTTGSASYRPPPPRQRSDPPTWAVPSSERSRHESIFRAFSKDGVLTGEQAKEVFGQFDVPVEKLADIWWVGRSASGGPLSCPHAPFPLSNPQGPLQRNQPGLAHRTRIRCRNALDRPLPPWLRPSQGHIGAKGTLGLDPDGRFGRSAGQPTCSRAPTSCSPADPNHRASAETATTSTFAGCYCRHAR